MKVSPGQYRVQREKGNTCCKTPPYSLFALLLPPKRVKMKYSQSIGIVAALALIGTCYLPWIYIPSLHQTYTGMYTGVTNFGRPGMLTMVLAAVSCILFIVPKIWAKRLNTIVAAVGISWAARNFLLLTACLMGECPEKKAGIFLAPVLALIIMIMALLPKLNLSNKATD